jgi:hypothetical protein
MREAIIQGPWLVIEGGIVDAIGQHRGDMVTLLEQDVPDLIEHEDGGCPHLLSHGHLFYCCTSVCSSGTLYFSNATGTYPTHGTMPHIRASAGSDGYDKRQASVQDWP